MIHCLYRTNGVDTAYIIVYDGGMELIHTTINVKYLPLPNKVEFIKTYKMAPVDLTRTSFVIPFINSDHVVMANNRRRGFELPGGHVELDETLSQAAQRECLEETGFEIDNLVPLGYLKMTSEGEVPSDWKYPHPISYQQFFTGETSKWTPYEPNDECKHPVLFPITHLDGLTEQQIMLILEAHQMVYPNGD